MLLTIAWNRNTPKSFPGWTQCWAQCSSLFLCHPDPAGVGLSSVLCCFSSHATLIQSRTKPASVVGAWFSVGAWSAFTLSAGFQRWKIVCLQRFTVGQIVWPLTVYNYPQLGWDGETKISVKLRSLVFWNWGCRAECQIWCGYTHIYWLFNCTRVIILF